ncbi:MAG TPA: glycosyl hydrolase 53 family protein, partial [Saprospiraceae bacterium]|nr:glycosyl hydrolase 53 family protein [Saprospiraceae bacterium]
SWHQDLIPAVGQVISNLKSTYPGKEVMILETAYPWTSAAEDNANNLLYTVYPGYPFSPASQNQWLIDLTQTVIDHGGDGVVYWEPDWVSTGCRTLFGKGSNWENCTFFDFNDNLIGDGGVNWMAHVYDFSSGFADPVNVTGTMLIYADHQIKVMRERGRCSADMELRVYDLLGREWLIRKIHLEAEGDFVSIRLPELSPDIYVAQMVNERGEFGSSKMIFVR